MINSTTLRKLCIRTGGALLTGCLAATATTHAAAGTDGEAQFRDLYRQLVEINTTLSSGSCTEAAQAMAARLKDAGLAASDIQVLVPPDRPRSGSLVATFPGRDRKLKPILLLAHIDVVEAKRADWVRDPFKLVEEGGFFYGRGASDDKAMAAVFTDTLVRFKREGFKPLRDVKLALTCGEETPETFNGVHWLLQTHPELLQAAFALNEGAGGLMDAKTGQPISLDVQAGEKVYQDFQLETTNPGGHSARPRRDNAILELANGLQKIAAYQFPIALNPATREYFTQQAKLAPPEVAADMQAILKDSTDEAAAGRLWTVNPEWNGMMRTTCVTTEITGGHAPNAMPQRATANVNCRILPGVPVESIHQKLVELVADPGIKVTLVGEPGLQSSPPPLTKAIMDPIRKVAAEIWPGTPIIPTMAAGATDGRYLNVAGIPTYGVSGMFQDAEGSHAHGLNERIRVKSLMDGRRFLYEIVKIYSQQKQ